MGAPVTLDLGVVVPDPPASRAGGLSAGRRLTLRQVESLRAGRHPVTGHWLHPDAPPVDDRAAPGPRCRGCGCGPGTALGAYEPCNDCGGDGRDHEEYRLSASPKQEGSHDD